MSMMRMPWTVRGQFVSGTAMVAILAAGCTLTLPGTGGTGGIADTFINSNKNTDLIGGVRMKTGEGVYGFGTWRSDGSVDDLTSIVYQDKNGGVSTLYLTSGRPTQLVGADGSRLQIVYDEVSTQRLKGNVTFTPATGTAQNFAFDIDLLKTAQQISDLVKQLIPGLQISSDAPPDLTDTTTKSAQNDRAVAVVFVPIFLVITGFALNLILSQILQVMLLTLDAALKTVAVVILTPFIVMGNLLRLATGQPPLTVDYNLGETPFGTVVVNVPRPEPI